MLLKNTGRKAGPTTDSEAPALDSAREEVDLLGNPRQYPALGAGGLFPWPWSTKAGREAEELRRQAELDLFRCTLETVRHARQALDQAVGLQALEAAEAFVFEVRVHGERLRFQLTTAAHRDWTTQFLDHLKWVEQQRAHCPAEMIDALKQRALAELTAAMNRLSKSAIEFDRKPFLGTKP